MPPPSPLSFSRTRGRPSLPTPPGERGTPKPCGRPSDSSLHTPLPSREPSVLFPSTRSPRYLRLSARPRSAHLPDCFPSRRARSTSPWGRRVEPRTPDSLLPPCSQPLYSSVPVTTSSASASNSPASPSSPCRLPPAAHLCEFKSRARFSDLPGAGRLGCACSASGCPNGTLHQLPQILREPGWRLRLTRSFQSKRSHLTFSHAFLSDNRGKEVHCGYRLSAAAGWFAIPWNPLRAAPELKRTAPDRERVVSRPGAWASHSPA